MGDEKRFSLGELADAAGMTARNVRAYQTRGLIPPPLRVGRRSEYTAAHLRTLRTIRRARADGASLALIGQYMTPDGTIDLTRAGEDWLPGPRPAGDRRRADLSGVIARVCGPGDPRVLAALEALVSTGVAARDGRRVVAGTDLVAAVTTLHRHGYPVDAALQVATRAAESGAALADRLGHLVGRSERAVVDHLARLATGVLREVLADRLGAAAHR